MNLKKTLLSTIVIFALLGFEPVVSNIDAATFKLSPASQTFEAGCFRSISIEIDATGQTSNAAEVIIDYDPTQVDILDNDALAPGTQVKEGNAYQAYYYNIVDESAGRIIVAAASFQQALSEKRNFATINFKSYPTATGTSFNIRFDGEGATLDSNIADAFTNLDLLTSVTSGNYSFISGPCEADTQPPRVVFDIPKNNQTNVPANVTIELKTTDNQSGIDLETLIFILNGVEYTINDPEVTYTGSTLNYLFSITPRSPLLEDDVNTLIVRVADRAGNRTTRQIAFNNGFTPPPDAEEPEQPEEPQEPEEPLICDCPTSNGSGPGDVWEVINNFLKNPEPLEGTILEDTIVDTLFKVFGVPGALSIIIGAISLLSLLPLVNALSATGFFLQIFSFFINYRNRKPWGIVSDGKTGEPLAFVACDLYAEGTQYRVAHTLSDLEGRYGFTVNPGKYRLEIKRFGYTKAIFEIETTSNNLYVIKDVQLNPIGEVDNEKVNRTERLKVSFVRIFTKVAKYLFFIGLFFSILSLFYLPTLYNVIIFILYLLVILLHLLKLIIIQPKTSLVINSDTELRIPFAQVKIFNSETYELVDTMLTNYSGYFDFYGEPGRYALLIVASGYKFPSKIKNTYELTKDKYSAMILADLDNGNNNLKIYVDPIKDDYTKIGKSAEENLTTHSPFS